MTLELLFKVQHINAVILFLLHVLCGIWDDEVMMIGECSAYLLAYCSILEWVSSWESCGDWDSLKMNGVMEMNEIRRAHTTSLKQRNSQAHADTLTNKHPNGPSQHHLGKKSDDPRKRKKGEQDDLRSSWIVFDSLCWEQQLNASWMLQRGEEGDSKNTVGECFGCMLSQWIRQADRQHAVQSWLSCCWDVGGGKWGGKWGKEVWFKCIPVWRQGLVSGGVDTHSYCSGHMLMRVTGLQEKRREGGREGGRGIRYHKTFHFRIKLSGSETKTQQAQEEVAGRVCPNVEWLDSTVTNSSSICDSDYPLWISLKPESKCMWLRKRVG